MPAAHRAAVFRTPQFGLTTFLLLCGTMLAKPKHSVEGVLFHWDGTLVNSYYADTSAYPAMFKQMGITWGLPELDKNYSPNWYQHYPAAALPRQDCHDTHRA